MDLGEDIFLTVFTPTFNRAELLNRGYTSLVSQTYKHFEWIIIDDGSTDNTKEVVDKFINERKIDIRYYYQENAGKHSAHNKVLQLAKGMFLLVLDSDDAFKDNAFETLLKNWNKIPNEKKGGYIGVTGLCVNQNGEVIGDSFPYSPFDSTSVEKYYKYNINGDKCGMMKMEIVKQFKFPEKKSSFYPEAYVWFTIGKQYQTRYINQVILIAYIEAKDSLSRPQSISKGTAEVMGDYNLFLINNFFRYSRYQPVAFLKHFILYASYASYSGQQFPQIIKHIKSPFSKLLGTILYPISILHRNRKNLK